MKGEAPKPGRLVERAEFISQFLCLSKTLLQNHLPENAPETEHMGAALKLLQTKFTDALGVANAQR